MKKYRKMAGVPSWLAKWRVVPICIVWYISSAVQSIFNKMILQEYNYPITVALANQVLIPILCIPFMRMWNVPKVSLTKSHYRRFLVPIALGRALATGLAAFSLALMPVSYQQTVKGLMPLFAVFMGRCLLNERQTWRVYASLVPIIVGVLIASVTELSFSLMGLIAALISTTTYSLLNILVKMLMKQAEIHPIRLLTMTSSACSVVLFPVWLLSDALPIAAQALSSTPSSSSPPLTLHIIGLLLCSSVCSFAQSVCTFALIDLLSALSYSVSNSTKRITVIVASLVTLKNPVTPANMAGMLISIAGLFCYSQAKQSSRKVHATGVRDSSGDGDGSEEESILSEENRDMELPRIRPHSGS